jgi:hypothetical protein
MAKTYFAEDGSYGDAERLVVMDTSDWTDEEWQKIEEASDWERPAIAQDITFYGDKVANNG